MFGTVIITVPAVLLAVGDPNAALLGVSWPPALVHMDPARAFIIDFN